MCSHWIPKSTKPSCRFPSQNNHPPLPLLTVMKKKIDDHTPRIDLKFINSPELSDVRFRVEGRIFYAHKIVLLTASSRFQSMLNYRLSSSENGNSEPPVLQINDIRY